MLNPFNNSIPEKPVVRIRRGRDLAHEMKRADPGARAQAAADLVTGQLAVTELPPRIANKLTRANMRAARAARTSPDPTIDEIVHGICVRLGWLES